MALFSNMFSLVLNIETTRVPCQLQQELSSGKMFENK